MAYGYPWNCNSTILIPSPCSFSLNSGTLILILFRSSSFLLVLSRLPLSIRLLIPSPCSFHFSQPQPTISHSLPLLPPSPMALISLHLIVCTPQRPAFFVFCLFPPTHYSAGYALQSWLYTDPLLVSSLHLLYCGVCVELRSVLIEKEIGRVMIDWLRDSIEILACQLFTNSYPRNPFLILLVLSEHPPSSDPPSSRNVPPPPPLPSQHTHTHTHSVLVISLVFEY